MKTENRAFQLLLTRYQRLGLKKSRLLERVREEVYSPAPIEEDCGCSSACSL